jgi:hypothetical protein
MTSESPVEAAENCPSARRACDCYNINSPPPDLAGRIDIAAFRFHQGKARQAQPTVTLEAFWPGGGRSGQPLGRNV